MDSTASHKWLAELENEEVGELDFIDALTMQQLADSLADELWDQPIHHQEHKQQQVELLDHRQQRTNTNTNTNTYTTGFPFHGGNMSRGSYAELADEGFLPTAAAISAAGGNDDSLFSFTGSKSEQLMSFSSREPKQKESNGGGSGTTAAGMTPLTPMEGSSQGRRRPSSGVHEHVVAERKRREKMNHQFAALASIIPGITKTDKVSLLGSTIDYVHHLKGRLKDLQAENKSSITGSTAESPPLDARCCVGSLDDDEIVVDGGVTALSPPKIEAEVRGTTVLLRVVCREKKGVLIMLLKELEKHGLSTINTNVLLLAGSSLNITITAQIEDGFSTTIELVNNLNAALKKF